MSLIERVSDCLRACPLLPPGVRVCTDGGESGRAFLSLSPSPAPPVLARYLSGRTTRAFDFALYYGADTLEEADRLAAAGFCEALERWLAARRPVLDPGQRAEGMDILESGWLSEQDSGRQAGVYRMVARMTYDQEAME